MHIFKKKIIILMILIFLGILYSFFSKTDNEKSLIINKIYIPNIIIDNKNYSIENGNLYLNGEKVNDKKIKNKAKNLGSFFFLSKIDPLFVSEIQFDSIDDLEKSVNIISKINDYYKKENLLKFDVYPISYLKQYVNTIRSQKQFYSEINYPNAVKFIENLNKLNQKYAADAGSIKKSIEIFSDDNDSRSRKMTSLGNYTDFNLILYDYDLIIKNSLSLIEEIQSRRKCLENYKSCNIKIKKGNIDLNLMSDLTPKTEKKLFKINTKCFGEEDEIFSVKKMCPERLNGLCYNNTDLAYKNFFIENNNVFPFERYLKERGLNVIPKNVTMPYNCMNYGYQTTLSNLNYYYENFSYRPFFNDLGRERLQNISNFDELRKYENQILAKNIIVEDDLKNLGKIFSNTFAQIILDGNYKEENYNLIDDLVKRSQILNSDLMDLELILNHIISVNINYIISNKLRNTEANLNTDSVILNSETLIYSYRNDYSIFFLNFSPFVWKIQDKLIFFKNFGNTQEYIKKQGLLDFNEVSKIYGEDTIKKWENIFSKINKGDFYYRYFDELRINSLLN